MKRKKRRGKVISIALMGTLLLQMIPGVETEAAITKTQQDELRNEMYQMIVTGDTQKHDVSKYKATVAEISEISEDLCKKEAAIPIRVTANQFVSSEKENGYVKYIFLYANDPGFLERYERVKESIAEIMDKIDPGMTDLEKVLIVHDYIAEHTYYKNDTNTYLSYVLGGPLGEGYGSCTGYAEALIRVLWQLGIEADSVGNGSHGWAKVKIDGTWYHVDPTWADTRSRTNGETSHYFFLRNDQEYINASYSPHKNFGEPVSTSTKYTDWYVHDIEGNMMYEAGMWYYESNGSICRNDIEGNSYKVVVAGNDIDLLSVEHGVITYTEGGKNYQAKVDGNEVTITPKPTNTATPKPTNTAIPKPTNTATPKLMNTATPKPTNTATLKPTNTATPKLMNTATPKPTNTVTPKLTSTITPKATNTVPPNPTNTVTSKPTNTVSPNPTNTVALSPTDTVTSVPTETVTPGPKGPSETEENNFVKYIPVKSIEVLTNNNKGYFDTGIKLKGDYNIEFIFEVTNDKSAGDIFSYESTKGTNVYLQQCGEQGIKVGYSWLYGITLWKPTGETNIYEKVGKSIYLNGQKLINGTNMMYNSVDSLRVGSAKCKIYGLKIWDGNEQLLRDYIPVLDEDGEICMYDKVEDAYVYYTTNSITYTIE